MLFVISLFGWILLQLVSPAPQINMELTEWVNSTKNDLVFQHNCLRVVASIQKEMDPFQIISYCLTELPSTWNIQPNTLDQRFTFAQLYQQNITGEQLYRWSAPLDVIERYQLYLDLHSSSDVSSSTELEWFYNCSAPRFGPSCEYSLDIDQSDHGTLHEMIFDFYRQEYKPTTLTCYTHLECNRGSSMACLDWSEICDGYINCLNDAVDEKNCWQLEINECGENEYRCDNGYCIARSFYHDDRGTSECLDRSDEIRDSTVLFQPIRYEPTFATEDIVCPSRYYKFLTKHTSSCVLERGNLLIEMLFLDRPSSLSDVCWLAFKCQYAVPYFSGPACVDFCLNDQTCQQIINDTCPDLLFIPAGPLAFGHIYLAYEKKTIISSINLLSSHYICYNDQLCGGFYSNRKLLIFNNSTCRRPEDFPMQFHLGGRLSWIDKYVKTLFDELYQCNTIIYHNISVCNSPTMYRCMNSSKCIAKHRLCDGKKDCDYKDDEHCSSTDDTCSSPKSDTLYQCTTKRMCISSKRVGNGQCDCGYDEYGLCDDEIAPLDYIRKHISFPTVCDGFTELAPMIIDGRIETDETECEHWQCNNTYTRCNGFWNCLNGADEVDCDETLLLTCPLFHHPCVSPHTHRLICLPIRQANDGNIDCVGATDEPERCRLHNYLLDDGNFYCHNDTNQPCISFRTLCYYGGKCMHGDEEAVCTPTENHMTHADICGDDYATIRTDVQTFLCERLDDSRKIPIVHFAIDRIKPPTPTADAIILPKKKRSFIDLSVDRIDQRCHRGLPLRVWLNNDENITKTTCLCPPSLYGDRCQYQNQRVSLTLQFQTFSDSRQTLFALTISLIDDSDERIIHSHEQLTYLNLQHCQKKFNMYLLYAERPKNETKKYSVHIDVYEKMSLAYRGSLSIRMNYPFLPVHRIAVQLTIPRTIEKRADCLDRQCIHGRCVRYSDDLDDDSFCRCDRGWSGRYCTRPHICTCSSDSLCVGVTADNRSICVCPLHKWGSLCRLRSTACQSDPNSGCYHGGQCVSVDEQMVSEKNFFCICRKGYSGERCEIADSQIIVSFHKDILLPLSLMVHFIRVIGNGSPQNGSTYKTIRVNEDTVTIHWSRPFHIAFVELFDNNYYLIIVQSTHNQSQKIVRRVTPSDRCEHISAVLNETVVRLPLLRRIKYYHLPCQRRMPHLSCFYDDTHFCLCTDSGHVSVANCFEFNPSIQHNCFGQSNCENGAQCLQDGPVCPRTSICVCPTCFYGTRCQFSSTYFGLSLDAILGYHIQPNVHMVHQPYLVRVSVALSMIMIIVGFVNGILSMITFKNKALHKAGSGLYLLACSMTTLFTITIFALKFWILIGAQLTNMTNRSFLYFQCISINFLLRIGLGMSQWLSACVSIERAITTIQETRFNQQKSKQTAKYTILFLSMFIIVTNIHDPIRRRLIDDIDHDDHERIWCIVTYSPGLHAYNLVIDGFHFIVPFLINVLSAIIIIQKTAQHRTRVRSHGTYLTSLREQFHRYNHLLIAPLILVILALPRLIISFASGCMKSGNDAWLFVAGYFISFIPTTLNFMVFVMPSKVYKQEFAKAIQQYRQKLQRRVHPTF